jgi:hypothetical protein
MKFQTVALGAALVALAGCSSSPTDYERELRRAVDASQLSLGQSVAIAEQQVGHGFTVRAELDVHTTPVFSVSALAEQAMHDLRIDTQSGAVLVTTTSADTGGVCADSVPASEAIATAEAEVGGQAVRTNPDDDNPCDREVHVLVGTNLWEVKVAPNGKVLETEEDDHDEE